MKFITAMILTALVAYAAGLQLPWWSLAIAAALVALAIPQPAWKASLAGFVGVCALWIILALILQNNGAKLISTSMASILPLGGSALLLALVSGVVGGLVAATAAYTGSVARALITPNHNQKK